MIVAVKVATISAGIRIKPAINRLQAPINTRNIEEQEVNTSEFDIVHIIFFQQGNVDILLTVHTIEEVLLILGNLCFVKSIKYKIVAIFFHTKHNGTAIGIGK